VDALTSEPRTANDERQRADSGAKPSKNFTGGNLTLDNEDVQSCNPDVDRARAYQALAATRSWPWDEVDLQPVSDEQAGDAVGRRVSTRVMPPSSSSMSRTCSKPSLASTASEAAFGPATVACTSESPRLPKP